MVNVTAESCPKTVRIQPGFYPVSNSVKRNPCSLSPDSSVHCDNCGADGDIFAKCSESSNPKLVCEKLETRSVSHKVRNSFDLSREIKLPSSVASPDFNCATQTTALCVDEIDNNMSEHYTDVRSSKKVTPNKFVNSVISFPKLAIFGPETNFPVTLNGALFNALIDTGS